MRFIVVLVVCSVLATEVPAKRMSDNIARFGIEMYQKCARETSENLIVSPFSVANTLMYLSFGANGSTSSQLKKGLHLSLNADKKKIAKGFSRYSNTIRKSAGNATLSIVNQIYVQKGYRVKESFAAQLPVQKFKADIQSVNFADNDKTVEIINRFVEDKTNNKIRKLFRPDMFDVDTRIALVNAVYFKGVWEIPFNKDKTNDAKFYVGETEHRTTKFMFTQDSFRTGYIPELSASSLEMRYAQSNYSFVIVLPRSRTGLPALESHLKSYGLAKIVNEMEFDDVVVWIPKFIAESEIDLKEILAKMNITDMFSDNADFSELLDSREPLYVSSAVHKAFISVDEEGSEAAAATGVSLSFRSLPTTFRADHPFVYFIWDHSSQSPLFMGHFTTV